MLDFIDQHYAPEAPIASDSLHQATAVDIVGRCRSLHGVLVSRGVRHLALCADNGIDWIVADLTCQHHGIRLLPLPTFFSRQQLRHALDTMAVDALLTDSAEQAGELSEDRSDIVAGLRLHLVDLPSGGDRADCPAGTEKVTFTSGSTGTPRGVCLSSRQQLQLAKVLQEAVGLKSPRHLCLLPLSTLLENIAGVYAPIFAHGEILVPSLGELGFHGSSLVNGQALLEAVDTAEPHTFIVVPQLLRVLVHAAGKGWRPPSSLRFIAVGGGKVPVHLLQRAHDLGLPVYEGYGLSECCSVVSLNTPDCHLTGSCGSPLPDVGVTIVDGEVHVSGNTMLGYAGDPASWHAGSVATGDLGYLDGDGFLHVNGRRNNLLISSFGRNISPEWIEAELLAHPGLAEAVVIGDARPYCVALLTSRDSALTGEQIAHWVDRVNSLLPDYARVRRWLILPGNLHDRAGLFTANGRPRRAVIITAFAREIDSLYQNNAAA